MKEQPYGVGASAAPTEGQRDRNQDDAISERVMAGHLDVGIRQPPVELSKQFADRKQREDAALNTDVQDNPFDRQDFFVLMISLAFVVLATWWFAP